jgi:hypothetical protein
MKLNKKTGEDVLHNVIYKITNGDFWGLLSLLKNF